MGVIRLPKGNFTTVENSLFRDSRISLKSKGLFCYMLSKKDGWSFSAERISLDNTDGRESVRSGLRELESTGYLKRVKINDGKGHFEVEYHLSYPDVNLSDVVKSDTAKAGGGKPVVGKPVGNSNTNYSNTNYNKTNKSNFYADASEKKINKDFNDDEVDEFELRKEKNSAKKESETKKMTKDEFRQTLITHGADVQHVADWFVVRDSNKAPYTLTALNKFLNECKNSNYPVSLAVQACAEYNWRGFEYQWILNKQKYATGQSTTAVSKPTANQDRQERIDSVKRMGDLARQIVANAINNGSSSD